MRYHLQIDLGKETVEKESLHGEAIVRAGRYRIAQTLLRLNKAQVDPLSPQNPLIFSAGPLAGTNFSNANRISVGCKSPLTGGIKEANAGGTFALALGQLSISAFTLHKPSRFTTHAHSGASFISVRKGRSDSSRPRHTWRKPILKSPRYCTKNTAKK